MITFENIKQILSDVAKGKILTTQELNSYGLTSNDIKELTNHLYLNRIVKGKYDINNISIVYNEALNFLHINHHIATKLLKKSFEINPKYKNCAVLIFKNLIKNDQTEESLPYFRQMLKDADNTQDNLFYLYMLNLIIDLPDDLKQKAESINLQDICDDNQEKNKLKHCLYEKNHRIAQRLLDKGTEQDKEFKDVTKYLLRREQKLAATRKKEIYTLIKNKEYKEVTNLLKKTLNSEEDVIAFLIKAYNFIKNTNFIPKKTIINTLNLKEAISGNNFELAYKLSQKLQKENEKNSIHLLLQEINTLIKSKNITEKIDSDYNSIHEKLINSLNLNVINYELLYEYLVSSRNEKYEKLIRCLIKMDIHENNNFQYTKDILKKINENNFELKRTYFIKEFNKSMNKKDFDAADIYLNVIECLEDLKEEHNLYKYLRRTLNQKSQKPYINLNLQTFKNDDDYIELKNIILKLNEKRGIILLPPMNETQRLRVHELAKSFKNINSQTIGEDDKKQVFLSYVRYPFGTHMGLQKQGYEAFSKQEYGKALAIYKKLIELGLNYHDVFGNIGKIYLAIGKKNLALPYLIVAYNRAKEFNKEETEEYLALIEQISNNKKVDEQKIYFEMTLDDFRSHEITTPNLNDILYLVYEEKTSIEEACQKFGYNDDQINMVRLTIVKEEYIRANYALGDKILKKVEKSKNKSKEVKEFYKEVYKNRLFYKNRPQEKIYKKSNN